MHNQQMQPESPKNSRKHPLAESGTSDDEAISYEPQKKKQRLSPPIHDQDFSDPFHSDSDGHTDCNTNEERSDSHESVDCSQDKPPEVVAQSTAPSQKSSKSRRYFDEADGDENGEDGDSEDIESRRRPKNFKCYNCDGVGHIARNCPKDPIVICFKCGESGHSGYRCVNAICALCLKDHPVHECDQMAPDKRTFTFCLRCGSTEHFLNRCEMPMAHRVARLQCFVCGEYGHLNCKAMGSQSGLHRPKRVQLCSNCGSNRHTVYFCKEMPMDNTMIAIGLSTAPHEPKICFKCLSPGHDARVCPLTIRQKRHRRKRDSKYTYRSTSAAESTATETATSKRNVNQIKSRKRKMKAAEQQHMQQLQRLWREQSMALIKELQREKKKEQRRRKGSKKRSKLMRKGKNRFNRGLQRLGQRTFSEFQ